MNQLNKLLVAIASVGALIFTAAACRADDIVDTTNAAVYMPPPPLFQPFTVGAEIGTTGYGGAADWRFMDHLGIGAAFDTFIYTYHGSIESGSYGIHLHLQSEPLTLNVYPWKRSSFRISVGALLNQNRLSGSSGDTITINGNTYGNPIISIKQGAENAYLTVGGNLYFDHGHHVSLGGQLGVIYTGDPKVFFTATGITQTDQQTEQAKIQHYANDFKFWPVVKLSLNYSF
ncbi:MAG TPA: hypothetical protein VGY56_04995 [Verrucomicrobiae bacterium]|nr:hypothetical protein [Verrucomicrobiae bacterium]